MRAPPGGRPRRRVLYLVEALFVGGREEVILVEAKYLDRTRFEPLVCVLSDKEGPVAAELRAAGAEVVALGRFDTPERAMCEAAAPG